MRILRIVAALLLTVGLAVTARPAAAEPTVQAAPLANNVHIFYYSWYGNPQFNGSYRHWPQGGFTPPLSIGANFYPVRGAYDSGDYNGAVEQHMAWIAQARIGVIVYSWWGRGSYEDNLAAGVLAAAARHGITVAWHLEPYANRTAQSTVDDINYIITRYGASPAFHRDPAYGNRAAFYVFESLRIADWSALQQVRSTAIVLAQTTDTSKVANFGGMYTYDAIAGNTAPGWANAAAYCRANGLVWAPSIGPGYIDDRAVPGNTTPTLGRENGATYDRQWTNAVNNGADWISITSFNEWHEGSVIEPASSNPPAGNGYLTFQGAYGTSGTASETAYLDRTRYWIERTQRAVSLRARVNGRYVAAENAGAAPLIANRTAVGAWEQFERIDAGGGAIALRSRVNGLIVTAGDGSAPLIANRTTIGPAETFQVVSNADGSVALRSAATGRYVAAEGAGASPLIANRTAVGSGERFDLLPV